MVDEERHSRVSEGRGSWVQAEPDREACVLDGTGSASPPEPRRLLLPALTDAGRCCCCCSASDSLSVASVHSGSLQPSASAWAMPSAAVKSASRDALSCAAKREALSRRPESNQRRQLRFSKRRPFCSESLHLVKTVSRAASQHECWAELRTERERGAGPAPVRLVESATVQDG
jgi:hypothetical protein